MTRQEFIDDITHISDLVDFCYSVDCDVCEGVYDDEGRDDYLNEQVSEWSRNDAWYELRDALDNIPTGYDWWIERLAQTFKLYDVVRIDHFRGFDEYWAVP